MNLKPLLDFIAKHESRGDYNIVWGGINKADRPKKPLVTMTIQEVLVWQDSIDSRYRSEAAGRYQIMEDTLRPLRKEAKLTPTSLFNEANQDQLATALLHRRGLTKYLNGQITTEQFCNELAKEWASLPVVSGPKKGKSYYSGDGLNEALVDVGPFLDAVKRVKSVPPVIQAPTPVAKPSLIQTILDWLGKFLKQP